MKSWFQPKGESDNTTFRGLNQPQIHLSAFGKHPGWEDHIPGIGLKTEGLAQVKQTLYVGGIGGQIDAGAWRKLEQDKRLPGFDHWFLWRRGGTLFCGRLWSSQDRGGRKEYPMVLCMETTQIPASVLLSKAWAELERLRETCQRTDSAITVTAECGASEARFRQGLAEPSGPGGLDAQVKRAFLDHPSLGPDRLGLLRVVHEMDRGFDENAQKPGAASFDPSRSQHWRVPLGCETDGGALLLWFEFLGKALPANVPLLLITRAKSGWVEVVLGEPHTDDLFCLQASLQSLPLATQIPYEQHWEPDTEARIKSRLADLQARFLGENRTDAPASPVGKQEAPRPVAPKAEPTQPETPKPRRSWWMIVAIAVLVLLAIPIAWWVATGGSRSADRASEEKPLPEVEPPTQSAASKPAVQALPAQAATNQAENDYQAATNAAGAALSQKNYLEAVRQADLALAIKPADAMAAALKEQAQQAQAAMAKAEADYQSATNAAGVALAQKNYSEVVRQAELALAIKPSDAAAVSLKTQAQQAQQAMLQAEKGYQSATNAAGHALESKNYAEAVRQADLALVIKPGDAAASSLRAQAQKLEAEAATETRYTQAIAAARGSFDGGDYAKAIEQATLAMGMRKNDPEALALKAEAERLQKQALATARYDEAMQEARDAFDNKDYPAATQRASEALQLKPGDQAASGLKSRANAAMELQRATDFFAAGEYDKAQTICAAHTGDEAFASLAKAIEEKKAGQGPEQVVALDLELQKLLVKFNVLSAKDDYIQSPEARQESRLGGRIGPDGVDYYLAVADRLEAGFAKAGVLGQNERETYLRKLRAAIPRLQ